MALMRPAIHLLARNFVLDGHLLRGDATGDPPPLVYYVSMRIPDRGGAPDGTPELYFTDPDGLKVECVAPRALPGESEAPA